MENDNRGRPSLPKPLEAFADELNAVQKERGPKALGSVVKPDSERLVASLEPQKKVVDQKTSNYQKAVFESKKPPAPYSLEWEGDRSANSEHFKKQAIQYYKAASNESGWPRHPVTTRIDLKLGDSLLAAGRTDEALVAYENAQTGAKSFSQNSCAGKPFTEQVVALSKQASIYMIRADKYKQLGTEEDKENAQSQSAVALSLLEQARDYDRAVNASGDSEDTLQSAQLCEQLAAVHLKVATPDIAKSEKYTLEALRIRTKLIHPGASEKMAAILTETSDRRSRMAAGIKWDKGESPSELANEAVDVARKALVEKEQKYGKNDLHLIPTLETLFGARSWRDYLGQYPLPRNAVEDERLSIVERILKIEEAAKMPEDMLERRRVQVRAMRQEYKQ